MDKDELNSIKVKFNSYYKYRFCFTNEDGYVASCGGIHEDIYRAEILAGKEYTIQEVYDICGGYLYVWLNDKEVCRLEQ